MKGKRRGWRRALGLDLGMTAENGADKEWRRRMLL